ncbi:hypothetical protein L208DRAFT_1273288 [Tricholoma matsutake]|nr:hypothetical protein L208DRAFT_1273288 [Tricholoma matsutake 945]
MAPARSSTRRAHLDQNNIPLSSVHNQDTDGNVIQELFIDPMLGVPLSIYIEKDVEDRDIVVDLINKHGGTVSPGYSGVTYILVDPHKSSGQNLWRQYAGKKGKLVLNSRWIHECVKAGQLQTFHTNWAGCKVTGTEVLTPVQDVQPPTNTVTAPITETPGRRRGRHQDLSTVDQAARQIQPQPVHPQSISPMTVDPLVPGHNTFPYPVYTAALHPQPPRGMPPAPPQTWQESTGIAPQQTHLAAVPHMIPRPPFREDGWDGYDHTAAHATADGMAGPATNGYDYRYRDDQTGWVGGNPYYDPSYDQAYDPQYIEDPNGAAAGTATSVAPQPESPEKTRGRKRTRSQAVPATPAASLVVNKNPPARSPTPPTRVIKSTYGGNLFTADDVQYLKRYIDYCQEQGLVLSLREICERIAVKAPHHTFYSWRRYCNKHQIRLGGYVMSNDRSISPTGNGDDTPEIEEEEPIVHHGPGLGIIAAAQARAAAVGPARNRSPTPPRALFRSTTGKGVAFTDEDVTFLIRFMEYRKSQGRVDMVAFWKDVAIKAPHHSRASWMKFWRRHKHEFSRTEADAPLPQPPEKKMRYSRGDDILLAKYFFDKPEGTSDKVFQAFGRMYSHHPWKGWQEHHRIHKAKIDHFMQLLGNGESLDEEQPPVSVS